MSIAACKKVKCNCAAYEVAKSSRLRGLLMTAEEFGRRGILSEDLLLELTRIDEGILSAHKALTRAEREAADDYEKLLDKVIQGQNGG